MSNTSLISSSMSSSVLNPEANPWFPIKSILPHAIYHPHHPPFSTTFHLPPPQYNLQPPFILFQQPIQLFNINTTLHVPFHQPQLVISNWNGASDHNDPKDKKVQRFAFKVTTTTQCYKKKNFFYSTPPRFIRRFVEPPSVTKVWKVKKSDDDVIEDGTGSCINAENVLSLADEENTSVMIRNIPNMFRREDLLGFLDIYCVNYHLEYDFVYLPMDFMRHNNLGYAFVNFTTSFAASKFMSLLEGYKWSDAQCHLQVKTSKKVCQINWAKIQGKEELVKHFQESKFCCEENEYLPVVFSPPRNGSTCLSTPSTVGKLGFKPTQRRH